MILLWPRLETQLRIHAPDLASRLRPGASEAELEAYEAEIGWRLPDDLRTSYLRHGGCDYPYRQDGAFPSQALLGELQWMPVGESLEEWCSRDTAVNEGGPGPYFFGGEEDTSSWSGMRIRPWQAQPGSWIPVGRLLNFSDRLYVDMPPTPEGFIGQLIFERLASERRVESTSWGVYLLALTEGLEQGLIKMVDDKSTMHARWCSVATGEPFVAPGFGA